MLALETIVSGSISCEVAFDERLFINIIRKPSKQLDTLSIRGETRSVPSSDVNRQVFKYGIVLP
jgi:ribosomal protein L25 (general stress protein Ctc)